MVLQKYVYAHGNCTEAHKGNCTALMQAYNIPHHFESKVKIAGNGAAEKYTSVLRCIQNVLSHDAYMDRTVRQAASVRIYWLCLLHNLIIIGMTCDPAEEISLRRHIRGAACSGHEACNKLVYASANARLVSDKRR